MEHLIDHRASIAGYLNTRADGFEAAKDLPAATFMRVAADEVAAKLDLAFDDATPVVRDFETLLAATGDLFGVTRAQIMAQWVDPAAPDPGQAARYAVMYSARYDLGMEAIDIAEALSGRRRAQVMYGLTRAGSLRNHDSLFHQRSTILSMTFAAPATIEGEDA